MGRKTWEEPFMPTPLKSRVNVLITKNNSNFFPGADYYINIDVNKVKIGIKGPACSIFPRNAAGVNP